mmetsp:Transcript_2058/g.8091  ORF Transcript_2058/g.8091 Transcript_2058/m.8091 type:complete len:138 (+) Transcript_2058:633-1046(+)
MKGMGLSFLGPPGVDRLGTSVVTRRGIRAANSRPLAAAIPGDTVAEGFVVTGLVNFFGIYQNLIISRILLSWFPALQRQPILQPIYTVCDPFLNVFRGVIPPIFGLDLSPIIAITLLQAFQGASAALGATPPTDEES